ncbi:MAG: hypothetical protein IKI11_06690 [Neisseriaceae bacterium]|nr:hypothetical protein [Neisseriaceae bacterium]
MATSTKIILAVALILCVVGFLRNFFRTRRMQKLANEATSVHEKFTLAAQIAKEQLNQMGYQVDYDLQSMKEIDRFFDDEKNGLLAGERADNIILSIGAFVGQTLIKLCGSGEWTDSGTFSNYDEDIHTVCLKFADDGEVYPVVKCWKRFENGAEDSIYFYVEVISNKHKILEQPS